MRGKLDLGTHKLANVYRLRKMAPVAPEKRPDEQYRQLWRLVDGAVRDTFIHHPEYLATPDRRSVVNSINKRVVDALWGYATQVAQGRSDILVLSAADEVPSLVRRPHEPTAPGRMPWWVTILRVCHLGGGVEVSTQNSSEVTHES